VPLNVAYVPSHDPLRALLEHRTLLPLTDPDVQLVMPTTNTPSSHQYHTLFMFTDDTPYGRRRRDCCGYGVKRSTSCFCARTTKKLGM
jgi:hypothetical protein